MARTIWTEDELLGKMADMYGPKLKSLPDLELFEFSLADESGKSSAGGPKNPSRFLGLL